MYKLARYMFMCGAVMLMYSIVVLCAMVGMWGWVVLGLIGLAVFKRKAKALWAYGSAAFASIGQLWDAAMIGGTKGVMIGRIANAPKPNAIDKTKLLFNPHIPHQEACERITAKRSGKDGSDVVRLSNSIHVSCYAPTGVGKGVSCILPFLLTCRESCVVLDWKDGENAKKTAKHRRKFGRVVLLDPWKVVTQNPDTLNPLDFIDNTPHAVDKCNALANGLVIRNKEDKNPHFTDKAEEGIASVIAATVHAGKKEIGTRSLQTVTDILSSPPKLDYLVQEMQKTSDWNGVLARMGGKMSQSVGEERGSVLSTIGRFTKFLNTPAVMESTKSSSFDPRELRTSCMTVYLIMPAIYMDSHSGLMRMWLVTLAGAVLEGGLQ